MEIPDAKASGWEGEIIGHQDTENAWDIVVQTIKEKVGDITTLAVEKAHLTVERLEALEERIPTLQVSRIDEKINDSASLNPKEELENMRKAAELADYAIEVGCKEIAEGKTELEILNAIELAVKEKGAAQCLSIQWYLVDQKRLPLTELQVIAKSKKAILSYLI